MGILPDQLPLDLSGLLTARRCQLCNLWSRLTLVSTVTNVVLPSVFEGQVSAESLVSHVAILTTNNIVVISREEIHLLEVQGMAVLVGCL